jgi:hypothetical protein
MATKDKPTRSGRPTRPSRTERRERTAHEARQEALHDAYIAALERELTGYLANGNRERATQVRKELRRARSSGLETATSAGEKP